MQLRLHRWSISAALLAMSVTVAGEAAAAMLQPKTVRGWEKYIQATEERIDREIDGGTAFLVLGFKAPEEQARIRNLG